MSFATPNALHPRQSEIALGIFSVDGPCRGNSRFFERRRRLTAREWTCPSADFGIDTAILEVKTADFAAGTVTSKERSWRAGFPAIPHERLRAESLQVAPSQSLGRALW
jgi:hypothetical protein